ncbi:helix-turn-helix domain-containing protein [Streptomyces sp. NPDC087901]|uniref:helix-turn-helix domain-containing protein n=1 Tax=Streptomyces sp. NPDC087901 TaxID=3365818 RepID=UPI0038268291
MGADSAAQIPLGPGPVPLGSLSGVGLTEAMESVYRSIVAQPAIRPDGLVLATGMTMDGVAASVEALVARGLVGKSGGTLTAVSPLFALGDLVAHSEREARMARSALDELADLHRSIRSQDEFRGLEVVRGRPNIGGWVNHLMRSTEQQLRMFAKPPFAVVGVAETEQEKELADRGLVERVIIERSLLDEPETEKDLLASLDRGQQIRLAEMLPSKLLIADDSLALVQLDDGGPAHDVVAVVRPGGLLTSLTTLFESLWERSVQLREAPGRRVEPYPASADDLGDPMDREVLTLLLAGYTDTAVAARLGVSLRTVQRRVRHLMDLAGTDSRILLGWYARDRGWL